MGQSTTIGQEIKELKLPIKIQWVDRVSVLIVLALAIVQIAVIGLTPLTLSADEAHYWEWSRRLDWSYYSKGPLVALLIAASTTIFGDTSFAVRLPAVLCSIATSTIWYLFVRKQYSPSWALVSLIALRVMAIFAQSSLLMTTDSPAILCWLAAVICFVRAVNASTIWSWLGFGFWLGLGVWSKYTVALLLPGAVIYLIISGRARELLSRGFISAIGIFILFLIPIASWNAANGWANFAHNAGHLVEQKGFALRPQYLLELIGGQLALVGPVLWLGIACAVKWGWSERTLYSRGALFSVLGLPFVAIIVLVSLTKRCYANWPLPIYIVGLLALVDFASRDNSRGEFLRKKTTLAIAISLLITVFAHGPLVGWTYGLPGKVLPSKKAVGWDHLGLKVEEILSQYSSAKEKPVVMSDYYGVASAISFYAPSHPFVYNLNLDDRRMTQYDIWTSDRDWLELKGRKALLVLKNPVSPTKLDNFFSGISPVFGTEPCHQVIYGAAVVAEYWCYMAEEFLGLPTPKPSSR